MTRYIQSDKLSMHIFRDGNFNSGVNKAVRKLIFKTAFYLTVRIITWQKLVLHILSATSGHIQQTRRMAKREHVSDIQFWLGLLINATHVHSTNRATAGNSQFYFTSIPFHTIRHTFVGVNNSNNPIHFSSSSNTVALMITFSIRILSHISQQENPQR